MLPADRPVSPEAAPPRATTPEPDELAGRLLDIVANLFPDWVAMGEAFRRALAPRASLSAAPSQEPCERCHWPGPHAPVCLAHCTHCGHRWAGAERAAPSQDDDDYGPVVLGEPDRLHARSSVEAREAERLRAALKEIASRADDEAHASAGYGDEHRFACAIGDMARASLRATPPASDPKNCPNNSAWGGCQLSNVHCRAPDCFRATTTQETKP